MEVNTLDQLRIKVTHLNSAVVGAADELAARREAHRIDRAAVALDHIDLRKNDLVSEHINS
jgi:hypothetical protein